MSDTGIIGTDVNQTSTTALFTPGTEIQINGITYVYIKATEALTANYLCMFNPTYDAVIQLTTSRVTTFPAGICVPLRAFASGAYGWAARKGAFSVFVGANASAASPLYTTTTPGLADDVATILISGLKVNSTVGGANAVSACMAFRDLMVG